MKTWHLRLVDVQGQALTQQRALLRYVLSWVWLLPPLLLSQMLGFTTLQSISLSVLWVATWAASSRLHPDRQYWHDQWAGTRLIDVRPQTASNVQTDLAS
jgi:uncharacterized RDD family membrane protein YckC